MATTNEEPCTTSMTLLSKDPQWLHDEFLIFNKNSTANNCLMEIVKGSVTCSGLQTEKETKFKLYKGLDGDDITLMFECIGGDSSKWMICVDSNKLSARPRKKDYINFADAEDDVLFVLERANPSESFVQFKWKKGDQFMGFDKQGRPIPLDKVDKSSDEAMFLLHAL